MQSFTIVWSLSLFLVAVSSLNRATAAPSTNREQTQRTAGTGRHLAAVRGEISRITSQGKGMWLITVKPAKEFQEVTVLARENDLVGIGVGRAGEPDLLGLLSDDPPEDETITAAELKEGDVVSVIYDPQLQNRVLEIYLH